MKHLLTPLLLCIALTPCIADTNLISNGDFETSKTTTFFGTTIAEFTDWTFPGLGTLAIDTTDVYSGKQAMLVNKPTQTTNRLSQSVDLQSDTVGQTYQLTIHYKTLTANEGDIALNSQWEYKSPQSGTPHDSATLNQVLPLSSDWKEVTLTTTKPKNATSLLVSLSIKKGAVVLFDDFSLIHIEPIPTPDPENPDTPTNIENITNNVNYENNTNNANNLEVYTISGQRLNTLQQGVNIIRQGTNTYKIIR